MAGEGVGRVMRFSLSSLNLHCGRDTRGRPYPLAAAIRALDTDVVVLQENWRPHGSVSIVSDVATELGYEKPIELDVFIDTNMRSLGVVDHEHHDEIGTGGLAILTRVPLSLEPPVSLGRAPGDSGTRMAQVALIGDPEETGEPTIRLVNTHLTHRLAYGPGQLRRLVEAIPAVRSRPAVPIPTVLAGDFNMFRPTIRLAQGYRSAVRGRTWPAVRPAFQIDHILTGPGLRVSGAQVGDPVGSDHLPVYATIHSG